MPQQLRYTRPVSSMGGYQLACQPTFEAAQVHPQSSFFNRLIIEVGRLVLTPYSPLKDAAGVTTDRQSHWRLLQIVNA